MLGRICFVKIIVTSSFEHIVDHNILSNCLMSQCISLEFTVLSSFYVNGFPPRQQKPFLHFLIIHPVQLWAGVGQFYTQ